MIPEPFWCWNSGSLFVGDVSRDSTWPSNIGPKKVAIPHKGWSKSGCDYVIYESIALGLFLKRHRKQVGLDCNVDQAPMCKKWLWGLVWENPTRRSTNVSYTAPFIYPHHRKTPNIHSFARALSTKMFINPSKDIIHQCIDPDFKNFPPFLFFHTQCWAKHTYVYIHVYIYLYLFIYSFIYLLFYL